MNHQNDPHWFAESCRTACLWLTGAGLAWLFFSAVIFLVSDEGLAWLNLWHS